MTGRTGAARFTAAIVLLTMAALCLRLPRLGNRPFHGDEAVHAFKFRDLWEHGEYRYDPNEFHGPTLYYAALPTVWLSGHHRFPETTEADYRAATALVGAAMVPLLLLLSDGLGRRAAIAAAILTAVSPAFVFYSRYYIQEVLLACFALPAFSCAWRYSRSGRAGWLAGAAICAGLMIATKETAVFSFVAAGIAWAFTCRRWRTRSAESGLQQSSPDELARSSDLSPGKPQQVRSEPRVHMAPADMDDVGSLQPGRPTRGEVARHAAWAVALALAVAYTFLSGTFSHPAGPLGYLHAFTPWAQRAGGTELHRHPWYYYVAILLWTHRAPGPVWSEGVIVGLALVGGAAAYTHRLPRGTDAGLARFLVVYTVALTAIYSAIPYKTPWLLLSFLSGAILLAGVGAVALLDWLQPKAGKAVIALALAAGCAQLGWLSCVTSFRYVDDTRNPYVYAQPLPGVAELGAMVTKLATFSPQREAMVVKVVSVDDYYWPLPWYLRRFPNVGYWTAMPADPEAPVVIASPAFDDALSLRLPNSVMTHIYPMRPGVFLELFARNDVWDPYVNSQPHRKLQIGE